MKSQKQLSALAIRFGAVLFAFYSVWALGGLLVPIALGTAVGFFWKAVKFFLMKSEDGNEKFGDFYALAILCVVLIGNQLGGFHTYEAIVLEAVTKSV
jgi:hypothetical protein